jgi:arginyl-tRNA synthetase
MPKNQEPKEKIVDAVLAVLKGDKIKADGEEIYNRIEVPPTPEMGDFALPCFFLASKMKRPPHQVAMELRAQIKIPKGFKAVQLEGPYLNFFVDRKKLTGDLISEVLSEGKDFGKSNFGKGEKVMVEFSQANTHKAFHVGHIRGTSLGESIARIMEFCGNNIVRANYQGDSGMHVAKWIWCYNKYHSKEKLTGNESWIASIYVDAVKRLGRSKKLQAEVEEVNRKLDTGERKELNDLWKETRKLCLTALEKIYTQLNTHFDAYYFESDMEKRGKQIVESMMENGFAKKSEDATIIDLEKYGLGIWVLIRKDGTILYSAKDLALTEKKFLDYPKLTKSVYVIANEQNLHFQQLVKTLEVTNFGNAEKLKHVAYGLVRLPTGKMSSRTGQNILYSDFLHKVLTHTTKELKDRYPKLEEERLEDRAMKISIAAIKYDMLKQDEKKNLVFNIKESLNFEGNSGPYILYSYARASSIIKHSTKKADPSVKEMDKGEIALMKKMSEFPSIVQRAYETLSPSLIANYSYQLARVFNEFYHKCPVVKSQKESFRLSLVEAFRQVISNSLYLLGIDVLEEM